MNIKQTVPYIIGISLLFIVQTNQTLIAESACQDEVALAAKGWLTIHPHPFENDIGYALRNIETFKKGQSDPLYYVVNLHPSGFIVVSGDKKIEPIISFANNGSYDDNPKNPLATLVNSDLKIRMITAVQQKNSPRQNSVLSAAQKKWQTLILSAGKSEGSIKREPLPQVSDVRVAPLLTSQWNQASVCGSHCYNYYTPKNYVCGCVATALAQVLRFYEYPQVGPSADCFTIYVDRVAQSACLRGGDEMGGPYLWTDMTLIPDCSITDTQREAIGALCYDSGISVGMWYGAWASGANTLTCAYSLRSVFGYDNAIQGYNSAHNIGPGLNTMVNPNLDDGRPVILGISSSDGGHAIVTDGYGYESDTLYHHLNLGWSGLDDAWYNLPAIPTSYVTFESVYKCVYNIYLEGTGEIISGRITDTSGSPISDVLVTAFQHGATQFKTTTNQKGIYAFSKLPSDTTFTIRTSKAGFLFTDQTVRTSKSRHLSPVSGNLWQVDFVGQKPPTIIYVDRDAPGLNDGTNWNDAFRSLQAALDVAESGDEILVAEGTYIPTQQTDPPDNRSVTFQLVSGVSLRGGYAGYAMPDPNKRDIQLYETILSGDLNGNDQPDFINRDDNAYHVVTGNDTNNNTLLEGFTIYGGNGDVYRGGGIYNLQASVCIRSCYFVENSAYSGGGIYNEDSNVTIIHCRLEGNRAVEIPGGGGIYNQDSDVSIVDCSFIQNTAAYSGGAVFNKGAQSTRAFTNCVFIGNSANYGGAVSNNNCGPTITNCLFTGNTATYSGGALEGYGAILTDFLSCTFYGNKSIQSYGGALYARNGSVGRLVNSIVWLNTDPGNHQLSLNNSDLYLIRCAYPGDKNSVYQSGDCTVYDWDLIHEDPLFVDPNGSDCIVGTWDDNLRLLDGSPCVDAGDNDWLPVDTADLDQDGNTTEQIPLDLYGQERISDGDGDDDTIVDIGACELQTPDEFILIPTQRSPDINQNGVVDLSDLILLTSAWLENKTDPADIYPLPDGDQVINLSDFSELSAHWHFGIDQ
ncbi:MAG: C10 family peptidase [Sedimentisphaerales bacterium]|nr:C10 family peptidase [Sedimentisphaerales bacterium]